VNFPPLQTVSTGLVVAIVGFFSSFPIVLQGLTAMGATEAQASSGLMASALAMGLTAIVISLVTRQPSSVAWSTPGVAFLAVSAAPAGGFPEAVGAFLLAGALTVLAGLFRPLRRLAAEVPLPLAHALLAGVLITICAQPFLALASAPYTAVPILLTWFLTGQISRLFAVPAAVLMALALTLFPAGIALPESLLTQPELVTPAFSIASTLGLALPLFIITMATQNSPGMAVLRGEGYPPRPAFFLSAVGIASILSAPFGAAQTCLAAITSSLCAGNDSHPDKALRFWSAVMGGIFYCIFGLFAALIIAVAQAAPPQTLETLAGIALLGVFANSASIALSEVKSREAAAITFLTTASGVSILGLSGAVWGLALGGIAYFIAHRH
jgi:benzoate membrane transport protein